MKKPGKDAGIEESLGHVHHSVMNPLTVVLGYAQLLAARTDLDEEAVSQVKRILEQARECVRIVEELTQVNVQSDETDPGEGSDEEVAASKTRSILVVDDEPVILKLTKEVLSSEYDVAGCPTAEEAQRRLLTEDYDLVLLDLNLKGDVDGRDLYKALQVHQPDVADRVLFMSGGVTDESVREFLDQSGRGCIDKPFNIDTLRRIVAGAIGRG